MSGDERPRGVALGGLAVGEALELLARGELEVLGLLPRATNHTFLARVRAGSTEIRAVYKPRAGESPLWDFPEGTLADREVAAFLVAEALGWPPVPPTILRDGPAGPGMVQLFVEFDPEQHYFTLLEDRADEFRRVALFDLLVNNADRKGGHCLLSVDGHVFVIDHGICFHVAPKLRTVIWDFAGEPLPPEARADVTRLAGELAGGPLRERLAELLVPAELEATERRARWAGSIDCYPEPGLGRPYPWPPL